MPRKQRGGSGRKYIGDKCEFTDPAGVTDDCQRGIRCTTLGEYPRTYNLCLPYKGASLAEHRRLLKPLDNSSWPYEREKAVEQFKKRFPGENFTEPKLAGPPPLTPEEYAAAVAARKQFEKEHYSPEYSKKAHNFVVERMRQEAERNEANFGSGGYRRSKTQRRRQQKQRRQSRRN